MGSVILVWSIVLYTLMIIIIVLTGTIKNTIFDALASCTVAPPPPHLSNCVYDLVLINIADNFVMLHAV